MATDTQRLQSALGYAASGLHVVMLGDAGTKRGKIPRENDWGNRTTLDEDELLSKFEQWPKANIGVLLGPKGGVIDVEFDSPEGRETADKIFGETITPTYESVRSIHRLFKWSDDFPPIQKVEYEGLEIRLGGGDKQTQSVLPPSQHPDGTEYRWLPGLSIHEVDLAELPEELAYRFANVEAGLEAAGLTQPSVNGKSHEDWEAIAKGLTEGGRNNALASLVGKHLGQIRDIDDSEAIANLYSLIEAWNERNKPPLPQRELRATFKSILNREKQRRTSESIDEVTPMSTDEQVDRASGVQSKRPQGLRLSIVEGDPPIYRLHSPRFHRCGGCIELSSSQFLSFRAVQTQAAEQAMALFPDELRKNWSKRGGIVEQLFGTAERLEPDTAYHRPITIAESILTLLTRSIEKDIESIKESGVTAGHGVEKLRSGGAAINLTKLLAYLKAENVLDQLRQKEVVDLLRSCGATQERSQSARWWELRKGAITRLRATFLASEGAEMTPHDTTKKDPAGHLSREMATTYDGE